MISVFCHVLTVLSSILVQSLMKILSISSRPMYWILYTLLKAQQFNDEVDLEF